MFRTGRETRIRSYLCRGRFDDHHLDVSGDAQAATPATRLSLSRVGVTGVEKIIRVSDEATDGNADDGSLFHAELECLVDLNPEQAGVHMSRFEEVVNEAIDEVVLGESLRAEGLAAHIAERVRERQGGLRAEVRIAARYPETVPAPVSGLPTQEIYTLFGTAVASERGTRTLTGVEAQGMTACPCAQGLVEDGARERLAEQGFDADEIERIVEASRSPPTTSAASAPSTSAARGLGRRHRRARPARIVESSMSSEIYELMKRADERAVVEKAHANPRFVEDCVREMIRRVSEAFPELNDERLRPRAPGEPGDDPPPQRRRRALRPDLGDRQRSSRAASTRRTT